MGLCVNPAVLSELTGSGLLESPPFVTLVVLLPLVQLVGSPLLVPARWLQVAGSTVWDPFYLC